MKAFSTWWVLALGAVAMTASGVAAPAASAELTLYNGQHKAPAQAVVAAFTKATGVNVVIRNGESPQLASQLVEEGASSPADVFYSEESPPLVALAQKGLLAKLDDETLKQVPPAYVAKDGTWIGVSARTRVVVYNKSMIEESALPPSVLDFAKASWKGKVGFVPTSGAFQEQIVAIEKLKGRPAALAWLKGLAENGKRYNGNSAALKAVENGEVATALINDYYWFALATEKGADKMASAIHYVGRHDPGALVTVSGAAVLKSSKNRELADRFLAFMVSEEGQRAISHAVAEYPLRPGVTSPFPLKPFADLDAAPITAAELGDAADAIVLEREAGID